MTNSQTKERLRVLHVISGDLWAGAEVQAYNLLTCLKKYCDVSVVLLNHGILESKLEASNIDVKVFDETIHNSIRIMLLMRQHINSFQPDIIHSHRQKENILTSLANVTSLGAPSLRTVHGDYESKGSFLTSLKRRVDVLVGRHLQDLIISVSSDLSTILEQRFLPDQVHTIHNGIDTHTLTHGLEESQFKIAKPDTIHIGIIGRLVPVKRVDLFLGIAKTILSQCEQEICFHIVGNGPLLEDLRGQCDKLEIMENVEFHGLRSDIPNIIYSLDFVVLCSDHEGLPMIALETLAIGTRLIAHSTGGIPELKEYENLHLVSNHSIEGYTDVLIPLFKERPRKIEKVANKFNHDIMKTTKKTLDAYQLAIEAHNA